MSRKLFGVIVLIALLAISISVVAAQDDLSGTEVTIFGAFTDSSEVGAVESGFVAFEEATGIDVIYEGASDFEILINTRMQAGDAPDIACYPQPGLMNRFAEEAIDITTMIDMDTLTTQYNPSWIDMATATDGSGKVIGVWYRVVVKSLVWYDPQEFADNGYEVPETWDDMIALSDQIVEDGGIPWSISMESGAATGWVGTDWIEDILLRVASLDAYDGWTVPVDASERTLFSSDEVKRAFELFGQIALNEDYVFGGTDRILSVDFFSTGVPVDDGDAFMTKMGSFMPPWLGEERLEDIEIAPDGNLWYFFFPPIDEEFGSPVLVAGDVCSVYNDRPEVRAVVEQITTAEVLRPAIEAGIFISPHNDVNPDWYRPSEAGFAEILANADSFRFDGGDLQPGEVGAGTFWAGVVDYVSGSKDLDTILSEIDDSWPTG